MKNKILENSRLKLLKYVILYIKCCKNNQMLWELFYYCKIILPQTLCDR